MNSSPHPLTIVIAPMRRSLSTTLSLLLGFVVFSPAVPGQTVYPTGTTIWIAGATDDGFTLYETADRTIQLIDMDGTVVNSWVSPTPGNLIHTVNPLDDGKILVFDGPTGGPNGGAHTCLELDYDGTVLWSYTLPAWTQATTTLHHDSERLDNGNTLLLLRQEVSLPQYNVEPFEDDVILEVDPAGNMVWLWNLRDHATELGLSLDQLAVIRDTAGDWAHANSIDVIPPNNHADPAFAEGNIVISLRFTNTIAIIDKSTGSIVWRVGAEEDHLTWGQHWPHMIELGLPGEGNIIVFDNGSGSGYLEPGMAPGFSAVEEIDPVTKTVVWSYREGFPFRFWSNIVSGAHRLSNGNTLICSGVKGRLFEVQTDGTIVWEYMTPFSVPAGNGINSIVYRAYRLPYSWVPIP